MCLGFQSAAIWENHSETGSIPWDMWLEWILSKVCIELEFRMKKERAGKDLYSGCNSHLSIIWCQW